MTVKTTTARYDGPGLRFTARTGSGHEIVLDDSGVSRRHAELRPDGSAWTIEDLASTNGVRVNGLPIHGVHHLHAGDRVEMGSTEMLFELAP